MAIPTVQGSAVVSAPYGAATLDANALMGPGRGMQAIAQGIGQLGDVASRFAERKQDAINVAASADAEMQMQKAFNDYQIEMTHATDTDPYTPAEKTWVTGWDKKATTLKGQLLSNPEVSPAVKQHLEIALTHIAGESSMRIATQANTRTIQRQKAKLTNVADFLYSAGDKEKGDIPIDTMAEHGLIFPEEAVQLKNKGREMADFQTVNKGINSDPIKTLDDLNAKDSSGDWKNFDDLDENKREALKVEALRQIGTIRHDTVNDLVDRTNSGEIIGKDELQSLVNQRRLKATEMKWVLQQQKAGKFDPEMNSKFAGMLTAIDSYDPVKDPTHEQRAELFGQALQFPAQYRDEIKTALDKKLKPDAALKDSATADAKRYIGELRAGGYFGDTSVTQGKANNPKEFQAAYSQELDLRNALKGFITDNPKADAGAQRDFLNAKVRTMKTATAAAPLLNAFSGRAEAPGGGASNPLTRVVTSKADFDALPSGATFTYNGRTGVKK